jgi:hypothetical protein
VAAWAVAGLATIVGRLRACLSRQREKPAVCSSTKVNVTSSVVRGGEFHARLCRHPCIRHWTDLLDPRDAQAIEYALIFVSLLRPG